jgi:hypothetical protein
LTISTAPMSAVQQKIGFVGMIISPKSRIFLFYGIVQNVIHVSKGQNAC